MRTTWLGVHAAVLLALGAMACGGGGGDDAPPDTGSPPPGDAGPMDTGPADTGPPPARDAGPPPPPPPPIPEFVAGDPVEASPFVWTYVPVEGTSCMDGSEFGFGVNLNPDSPNVVIYFQGGNLCFDTFSCLGVANPDGFPASRLNATVDSLRNGVFKRDSAGVNPFDDWSYVFVPYCSGDLHMGNNPVSFRGNAYLGYSNTLLMLQRIVPTFADADKVLVTGSSAGAFGALANFAQIADSFEAVASTSTLYLLNDAGPPMADDYLKPCFQEWIREVFAVDSIPLIEECPECSTAEGGGLGNAVSYLAFERHPDLRQAYLSTMEDGTIRSFYGYGYSSRCNLPVNMPTEDYRAGLLDLRDNILGTADNAHVFLAEGDFHTFLGAPLDSSRATVGGVTLSTWLRAFIEDDASWTDLGP